MSVEVVFRWVDEGWPSAVSADPDGLVDDREALPDDSSPITAGPLVAVRALSVSTDGVEDAR